MKVYIIGNAGSFSNAAHESLLREGFDVELQTDFDRLTSWLQPLQARDVILYISGETRIHSKMRNLNFELPVKLLELSLIRNAAFFYLSSLAVFGDSPNDCITLASPRQPLDEYGRTKNLFDAYVREIRKTHSYAEVSGIYPASIDSGRGRSAVEKLQQLLGRYPILRWVRFPGNVSYVSRDKLINHLKIKITQHDLGDSICADHYELKRFAQRISLPIFPIPLILFKVAALIVGRSRAVKLRLILRGIVYQ